MPTSRACRESRASATGWWSGRGLLHNPWVGSGADVADIMEEWFVTGACDGFVIAASHVPGAYADFVKYVVPELQRRGLHRTD